MKNIHFSSYIAQLFLEWEIFQARVVEKIKSQILISITFFENYAVYEIMWKKKYYRPRQAADCIVAQAHCMLDNQVYKHTGYVIFTAIPLQQSFHEGASKLRYT